MSAHRILHTFLLLLCACTITSAHAEGLHIRVKGSAKIVARASRDQGDLVLTGALSDDAGQPIAGEAVVIHVTRESDPHDQAEAAALRAARVCDRSADRPPPMAYAVRSQGPPDAPDVVTTTDEAGRFCFRARLVPDRHRAHLTWKGSNLVDASAVDLSFDLSRQAVVLHFDPAPRIISLDEPRLVLDATAILDDDAAPRAAPGLLLDVSTEKADLTKATTDQSGRAHYAIDTKQLGPPGLGELKVSFGGNTDIAFSTHAVDIERHVKVTLAPPALDKPQVPEDGIALPVTVASSAGPVAEGAVEARIGDTVVGAAPVEKGTARLTLTFTSPDQEALVRLRYVPSSPWYEPLGESTVRVPIRGPSLWTKAPILVAGLAVLIFFLIGRVSARQQKPEPAPVKDANKEGQARIDVVRPAARGEPGWRGTVVDAHEGHAVGGARIWIERGTFEGRRILAETLTDPHGRFVLDTPFEQTGGEQLAGEGALYTRLVQPLPEAGELSIALILRRRALLQRLVAWAKRRGEPYDLRPEPTPGHVRRVAGKDPETAKWADAVEKAVFGAGPVDAQTEGEIERIAPPASPVDGRKDPSL